MFIRRLFPFLIIFILPFVAFSQLDNRRCNWYQVGKGSFVIDSLSVDPASIYLDHEEDSLPSVSYDINTGKVTLSHIAGKDSVRVCYRVLPLALNAPVFRREKPPYDTIPYREEMYMPQFNVGPENEIFKTPGINKTGSITRGISFGNNQNVFVNSALNLQMEGQLTEDISVAASISDQNIPFQPEGNTQNLQEFDKVFIQFRSKNTQLTAGDVVLKNQPGHFLKYYRNVQGGLLEHRRERDSSNFSSTVSGAAVSKGKFASIQLEPLDGVQGPYRVRGPKNERFIIVLANSEKVYLDGKLLIRGFDFDYTIDYNQGEITFTSNVLITRFSVLRVDFEYAERNYGRANIIGSHYQVWTRGNAYAGFFSQRDNPNNPLLLDLDQTEKEYLAGIGDNLSEAVLSGIDSVGYRENKIQYKKVDSAGKEIFVYSTLPAEAVYDVAFSYVGEGVGSYEQINSTVNGKVFKYVGDGLGSYLPLRPVPTPQKNQMFTVGGSYLLKPQLVLYAESAISENDQNLYSNLDSQDDFGLGIKSGIRNQGMPVKFWKGVKWIGSIDFEFNDKNFREIDRFRDINFERDWSGDPEVNDFNRILTATFGLEKNKENNIYYSASRRIKGQEVNGLQQTAAINKAAGKVRISANAFYLMNSKEDEYSEWKRLNINTFWKGNTLTPGIIYSMDKNKLTAGGEVTGSAMYYDEIKAYFKTSLDSAKSKIFADAAYRQDQDTLNGSLQLYSASRTTNLGFSTLLNKNNEIRTNFTYRLLEYAGGNSHLPHEETVLGRMDWNAHLLQRHIRSELTVTTATGRELRREFFYQEVPQGLGTHIWNDYNEDSLRDLNEFVEKVSGLPYNQQEFIRVFLPADDYVKAYSGTFNYRLVITAPRHWRNHEKKLKRFISRFSALSAWSVNNKILDADILQRFNPFIPEVSEQELLSAHNSIRSTLYFNRTNPAFGMDIQYAGMESRSLLTQGYETRLRKDLIYNFRWNVRSNVSFQAKTGRENNSSFSDFLNSRNYTIVGWKAEPSLSWQPKGKLRVSGKGGLNTRRNTLSGLNEAVRELLAGVDFRYNHIKGRTISGFFNYINILADFKETAINSPLGYEMLQALQPGNNFTWSLSWQERLTNGLQISLIYDGRKSETGRLINTGRMQASAFF